MPSVTKWKTVPPFIVSGGRAWWVSTNAGTWYGGSSPHQPFQLSSGHGPRTGPNMLRPRIQAPSPALPRSAIWLSMPVSPPSAPRISRNTRVSKNQPNMAGPPTPSGFSRSCRGPAPNPSRDALKHCTLTVMVVPCWKSRVLPGQVGTQAILLRTQLRRERLAEILGLEDLADLDLGVAQHRIGTALDPVDRLLQRRAGPQPVARHHLVDRERPTRHRAVLARKVHPCTLGTGLQALAALHDASLDQFLFDLPHRGQRARAGHHPRLAVAIGLDHHHESHRSLLVGLRATVARILTTTHGARNRHRPAGSVGWAAILCRGSGD